MKIEYEKWNDRELEFAIFCIELADCSADVSRFCKKIVPYDLSKNQSTNPNNEKNRDRSNRKTHLTLLANDAAILAVSLSFFIQK